VDALQTPDARNAIGMIRDRSAAVKSKLRKTAGFPQFSALRKIRSETRSPASAAAASRE
jgi:hypothetical protein